MKRSSKIEIYRETGKHKGLDCPLASTTINSKCACPGGWRWRLRSSNGKVVAQSSEGYTEPRGLVRGLEIAWLGYHLCPPNTYPDLKWKGWLLTDGKVGRPVVVPQGTDHLWHGRRAAR